MRGRAALLVALTTTAVSCWKGPTYNPQPAIAPAQRVGVPRLSDSTREFFDSLAAARQRDSLRSVTSAAGRQTITDATLNSTAWLEIIPDSTLVALVDRAIRQNRDVQFAIAQMSEFRANIGIARAPLLPSVSLNASESGNQVASAGFPATSFGVALFTANLAWELDFWGRVRRGVQAANADFAARDAGHRAVILSLVSDVVSGYLQLLELDQERTIAERTLSSRRSTLEVARERFSQGLTSELDVRQFEAQVAAPAVTLAQTERARAQNEHNLNVLLGEGPAPIPRGSSLADAVRALTIPDSIPAALLARRPDVVEAERTYAASVARIGIADAARWPTFSIIGSYGIQAGAPSGLFGSQSNVYQAFIGLSFPVFDNARLANVSAAARARAEQARASYEGVALNALREASDALTAVRTSRDQSVALATQTTALRQALDLATLRYEAGLATYLDLLDAQRSLFNAELASSQAQLGELAAAVQLYKALGGSWTTRKP